MKRYRPYRPYRLCDHSRRPAATIGECLIAIALLLPVSVFVNRIAIQSNRTHAETAAQNDGFRELLNARERIGLWDFEGVTRGEIESMAAPPAMETIQHSYAWHAEVKEIQVPVVAKQITLSLTAGNSSDGTIRSVGPLTFWVFRP